MRSYGKPYISEFNVINTMFLTDLLNNLTKSGVMNMRYFWKQMMLNLKIQTACQPGNKFIFCRKIGSGFYLVYSPFIFHFTGFGISYRKGSVLNGMGKLKNKTQYKTSNQCKDEKTNKP